MEHLIDADKLRAEIERLKGICAAQIKVNPGQTFPFVMEMTGYDKLLSFLDTMQEPKFNLDKLREVAVPLSDEEKEAHRKLMDERRKKYEKMGMLQEREVDLEEKIKAWILHECGPSDFNPYADHWCADDIMETARHFYNLGKGDRDTIFHKGMMYYRKQMMEEAVDSYVNTCTSIPGGSYVEFVADVPASYIVGEKVRIIILKED